MFVEILVFSRLKSRVNLLQTTSDNLKALNGCFVLVLECSTLRTHYRAHGPRTQHIRYCVEKLDLQTFNSPFARETECGGFESYARDHGCALLWSHRLQRNNYPTLPSFQSLSNQGHSMMQTRKVSKISQIVFTNHYLIITTAFSIFILFYFSELTPVE